MQRETNGPGCSAPTLLQYDLVIQRGTHSSNLGTNLHGVKPGNNVRGRVWGLLFLFLSLQKYINPSVFENFGRSSHLWLLALISVKICEANKS